ncbi:MAG: hypothetical protein ACT4PV_13595 [Planctomycetaceae bacterium]
MASAAPAPAGEVLVCERRSFGRVLRSPWGVFMCLFAVISFGMSLFVLVHMHFNLTQV